MYITVSSPHLEQPDPHPDQPDPHPDQPDPHPDQRDPRPGQRDPVFVDAYARGRRRTAQECMSRGSMLAMFGSRVLPDVLEPSQPMTVSCSSSIVQ